MEAAAKLSPTLASISAYPSECRRQLGSSFHRKQVRDNLAANTMEFARKHDTMIHQLLTTCKHLLDAPIKPELDNTIHKINSNTNTNTKAI